MPPPAKRCWRTACRCSLRNRCGRCRPAWNGRLGLLLEYLREERVLLVLDNLEMLLEEGEGTGRMRAGYEDYGRLLRQVAQTEHQSCLLLTRREKPRELVALEGSRTPVRSLRLDGLDAVASEQLLAEKEVVGTHPRPGAADRAYGGNPLALKIVAQTIVELFGGEIAPFLEQGEVVFGSVRELLGEQFARLSAVEQTRAAVAGHPARAGEHRGTALGAGCAPAAGPGAGSGRGAAPPFADRARATTGELHAAIGGAGICDGATHHRGSQRDRAGPAGSPDRAWSGTGHR